jgi:hypothetical protein
MNDRYGPGTSEHLLTCPLCGGLEIIDTSQAQVNAGNHFFVAGYVTINAGGTIQFTGEVPDDGKTYHMMYQVEAPDALAIDVFENTADIAGGTARIPINSNRNSPNTSGATIKVNPAVTEGDKIDGAKWGAEGGKMDRPVKIILENGNNYMWRFVSGTDGNIVNYRGEWFEL